MTSMILNAIKVVLRWALGVQSHCAVIGGREWSQVGLRRAIGYALQPAPASAAVVASGKAFAAGLARGMAQVEATANGHMRAASSRQLNGTA